MHSFQIIDSHLHSGIQNVSWRWEDIRSLLLAAGITGAGVIPPVEDVYDRYDPRFYRHPCLAGVPPPRAPVSSGPE